MRRSSPEPYCGNCRIGRWQAMTLSFGTALAFLTLSGWRTSQLCQWNTSASSSRLPTSLTATRESTSLPPSVPASTQPSLVTESPLRAGFDFFEGWRCSRRNVFPFYYDSPAFACEFLAKLLYCDGKVIVTCLHANYAMQANAPSHFAYFACWMTWL